MVHRSGALALFLALPGCAAPGDRPAEPPSLTGSEWRLTGAFPRLPVDGYPIRVLSDGSCVTANLGLVDAWRLPQPGVLELSRADPAQLTFTFTWRPESRRYRVDLEDNLFFEVFVLKPAPQDGG